MKIQLLWKGLNGRMKNPLLKNTFREIKKSLGRFLSIFAIVALGVSFFAGIKAAPPDMKITADKYYDDYNFMDIRLVSTLGFDDKDVESIKTNPKVKAVMATYSMDVLMVTEETQRVLKVHGLPLEKSKEDESYMNRPRLIEGKLPKSSGQCVIEKGKFESLGIGIGDKINISSGTDKDVKESLKHDEFEIVGIVETPYYLSYEKGSSPIGGGKVSSYILIPESDFTLPAYTEIFLTVKGAKELSSYSKDYENVIDGLSNDMEILGEERATLRYNHIVKEAKEKLQDSKREYEEGKAKANEELRKASNKIDESEEGLKSGEIQLKNKETQFNTTIAEGERKLQQGEEKLKTGEEEYEKQYKTFQNTKASAEKQLVLAKAGIAAAEQSIAKEEGEIAELKKQLESGELSEDEKVRLQKIIAAREIALNMAKSQVDVNKKEIAEKEMQLVDGENQLREAKKQLEVSKATLSREKANLDQGKIQGKNEIEKAKVELASGKLELAKGKEEYEKNKVEVENKLKDAENKILDAEDKINSIKEPKWYVLDRNTNYSYVEYKQSAERVDAIAQVFPLFFFLVAALVCLTTMTRMVDEQRIDIGTLKALGYNKKVIASKYIMYAALASLGGSIVGLAIGFTLFPTVIFDAYGIMFSLPPVVLTFNTYYALLATSAAVLTTTLAALLACYNELKETPALLMRPKAPKLGKKILLERLTFLWKNMNFTSKVTARNIFRYKKRFLMTTLGVAGCTALLLAGFGIRDSIRAIVDIQYGELIQYDMNVSLDSSIKTQEENDFYDYIKKEDRIQQYMTLKTKNIDVTANGITKEVTLMVPDDKDKFQEFNLLRNRINKRQIRMEEDEVVLTEKVSKQLNVKKGDTITFKDENEKQVNAKIAAISENYVSHYLYMTKDTYEKFYGRDFKGNELIGKIKDTSKDEENDLSKELLKKKGVTSVYFNSGLKNTYRDTIKSLGYVVLVMIISAGALAFVVLYNLTNVNISERLREIATIKVLGFYDNEVSAYVYRENIILTVIGMIAGLILGIFLHQFIMATAELDNIMFGRTINGFSYIYSSLLTIAFSVLVNFTMYYKLRAIKMVESLKSVD